MKESLYQIEASLTDALEKTQAVAKEELAHCPSALALTARIGNAIEMLGSLKRESATLKAPEKPA